MDLSGFVSVLVNGGLTSVALVALYLGYKQNNGKMKMLLDIIDRNTSSHEKSAAASNKQMEVIQSLKELIIAKL